MQGRGLAVISPAVESLLASGIERSLWPKEVADHPDIVAAAKLRRDLYEKLDKLFKQIPQATTEIAQAIDSGAIEQEIIIEVYNLLSDFLDAEPYHQRLILYLPFELLPNRTEIRRPSVGLIKAIDRFVDSYTRSWRRLLGDVDVRANFDDGNILEPELSPNGQRMVCKAAHLIPWLVKKGFISISAILDIAEKDPNYILRESIADAIMVLKDMSLISESEHRRIVDLDLLRPFNYTGMSRKSTVRQDGNVDWLMRLSADSEFELKKIEMRMALDMSRNIPQPRVDWEKLERERVLIERYSDEISSSLASGFITDGDIIRFTSLGLNYILYPAVVNGVRKMIELIAKDDLKKARLIFRIYEPRFRSLWLKDVPGARDELTCTLSRLANLGVATRACLRKFGINLISLDAPISSHMDIAKREIEDIVPNIKKAVSDPNILHFIYPVVIFFGSRLKGYARRNADLDIAVLIRPGVDQDKKEEIRNTLSKVFRDKKTHGKVVEFWLTKNNSGLEIIDFQNPDISTAGSAWMHLLLTGLWFGNMDSIRELYTKLLPGFIRSKGKSLEGREARDVWLEEMEREVLQYRLLHKGYRRIYPEQGGIKTENSGYLDQQGSFWDSGYRRIATNLFITRVFIPQVE